MARGDLLMGEADVFYSRIGVALTTGFWGMVEASVLETIGITTYARGFLYKFKWLLTNE